MLNNSWQHICKECINEPICNLVCDKITTQMKTITLNESQRELLKSLINDAIEDDIARKLRYHSTSTIHDVCDEEIEELTSILELIL